MTLNFVNLLVENKSEKTVLFIWKLGNFNKGGILQCKEVNLASKFRQK